MFRELRSALRLFLALAALTGILYPLAVTALAQGLFPEQARGSQIVDGSVVRGSKLIGQAFDDPRYFWGRPSATAPVPCNASASSGSNLGPTNPALLELVRARTQALRSSSGEGRAIPVDLVTASASGLDPHISPAAARFQVERVAQARGLAASRVAALVESQVEGRSFGILGEARVNVLQLNLALDREP